tara:strand:- start:436 stop:552 length:117 start_codon:yes stop_codon:yes gene_type:complete
MTILQDICKASGISKNCILVNVRILKSLLKEKEGVEYE